MKKLLVLVLTFCFIMLAACGQQETKNTTTQNDHGTPKIASLSIHLTNDLLALGIKQAGSVVGGDLKDFLPHAKKATEWYEEAGHRDRSRYGVTACITTRCHLCR